jgi:hypothetical protein
VGQHVNESSVICRLAADVCVLLLVRDEEGHHLGSSPPLDLGPVRVICRNQRSVPEAHLAVSQLAIGKLEHHAAYVGVGEEVVSRELEIVQATARVVEEGVTAPASEEAVLARLRHRSFWAVRHRSTLDDRFPAVALAVDALDAADRRTLRPVL